jgi:hypothetical protein
MPCDHRVAPSNISMAKHNRNLLLMFNIETPLTKLKHAGDKARQDLGA